MSLSFSSIILFFSSMSTSYFLLHSDNSTFNSALNQRRNRRRSCFVGEFEKKLSEQSFGIFKQQTFCWCYWQIMQWYVRHQKTKSSERFFAPAMGPERGLQPRICNRVIRPMICRKERLSLSLSQFHPEKEQLMRIDLGPISIYFRIYHTFLVISKKVGQTFLSTISQPLKDGILLQHMKEIRRCIWFNL